MSQYILGVVTIVVMAVLSVIFDIIFGTTPAFGLIGLFITIILLYKQSEKIYPEEDIRE